MNTREQETLDEFFRTQLKESQRKGIEAACLDMWRPFTNRNEHWAPHCRIVYDRYLFKSSLTYCWIT